MYNSSAEANGSFPEHKVKQMLKDENDSRTTGPKIRLFTEDDYINLRNDNQRDSDDDCDDENQNIDRSPNLLEEEEVLRSPSIIVEQVSESHRYNNIKKRKKK